MSFHNIIQYLRYKMVASGRHGIHSPFVYRLIDNCLLHGQGDVYGERLPAYFGKENIFLLHRDPGKWREQSYALTEERVLLVPGIHKTAEHTKKWNDLVADERIMLTIDLFDAGLLINKREFKEKQHFVLKKR